MSFWQKKNANQLSGKSAGSVFIGAIEKAETQRQ